jgi:hypothetical protein
VAAPESSGDRFKVPGQSVPESLDELGFTVERNDQRILALRADGDGCGAYCEEWSRHYAFDSRTVRAVRSEDIFLRRAFAMIADRMLHEKVRLYSSQIAQLRHALKALRGDRKHDQDAIADTEERIALNQECLDRAKEQDAQDTKVDGRAESALGFNLSFAARQSLVFKTGRCSNHASRALDDVGDIALTIPLAELQPLLSPYGKALLLAEGDAPPPTNLFGQILRGTIGKRAITLRLDRPYDDGSFAGRYFYDKFRKTIELSGKRRGTQVELSETLPNQGGEATFTLTEKSGRLVGTWEGTGKSLPVEAHW